MLFDFVNTLLGALVGTLSQDVIFLITIATTSYDAWTTLPKAFANPSHGHIKKFKPKYKMLPNYKLNVSLNTCILSKNDADRLVLLNKTIHQEDLIYSIIKGLHPEDYKEVRLAINVRGSTIYLTELMKKHINHKLILKQTIKPSISSMTHTAFPVYTH